MFIILLLANVYKCLVVFVWHSVTKNWMWKMATETVAYMCCVRYDVFSAMLDVVIFETINTILKFWILLLKISSFVEGMFTVVLV